MVAISRPKIKILLLFLAKDARNLKKVKIWTNIVMASNIDWGEEREMSNVVLARASSQTNRPKNAIRNCEKRNRKKYFV